MTSWDDLLWWVMLGTGVAAAAMSITAALLDRRAGERPTRRERFLMHMASYGLMGVSMLAFALRGLLSSP